MEMHSALPATRPFSLYSSVLGGVRGHEDHWRSGGERAKIVFKNSRENSDRIISHVFVCNKNKALQLQRVPIISILGCNIDLYVKQAPQFPKNLRRKGGKFDHRPERPKVLLRLAAWRSG